MKSDFSIRSLSEIIFSLSPQEGTVVEKHEPDCRKAMHTVYGGFVCSVFEETPSSRLSYTYHVNMYCNVSMYFEEFTDSFPRP